MSSGRIQMRYTRQGEVRRTAQQSFPECNTSDNLSLDRQNPYAGPLAELAPRYEVGTSRPDSLRPPPARFEARG